LWGEVALEVRRTAFLRNVRIWANVAGEPRVTTATLHVAGEVVGTCERPLELYVLLDGSTVIYTTVEAEPGGRSFEVASEELAKERWRRSEEGGETHSVRVDLVDGACIWYALEEPVAFGLPFQPDRSP